MALEKTAEREMILLVFSGMGFYGSKRTYERLNTTQLIDERDIKILKPHVTVRVGYDKDKGLILMRPAIDEANALLCNISEIVEDKEGVTCSANYCVFDEEASAEREMASKVWNGFSIE